VKVGVSVGLGPPSDEVSHVKAASAVDALEDWTSRRRRPGSRVQLLAQKSRVAQRDQSMGPAMATEQQSPGIVPSGRNRCLCARVPSPSQKRDPQHIARGLFRKG
jgi:hypothetical protein